MSIASRITSMTQHTKEAYDKIESLGADLTGVNKNLDNIADVLDDVYAGYPKVTGSGTELSLSNCKKAGMEIEYKGNTSQASLPSDYTAVDYIESSGTQYIDTGYKHNTSKTSYEATLSISSLTNTTSTLFGARTTHNGTEAFYLGLYQNGAAYGCIGGTKKDQIGWTASTNTKYHILYNALNGLTVDGTNYSFTSNSNITYDKNDYIFALNSNGNVLEKTSYKLYAFKIRDNNVLVREFIPCYRNSDSVVGLYDLVNGVFYTNQGTGAFTYGSATNIPNPDYPQTIHTVTGNNTVTVCGKNLFDKNNVNELACYIDSSGKIVSNSSNTSWYIPCLPNTTYTVSRMQIASGNNKFGICCTDVLPANNVQSRVYDRQDGANSITITSDSVSKYLLIWTYVTDFVPTKEQVLNSIQVELRLNSYFI